MRELLEHCTEYSTESTSPLHHLIVWKDEDGAIYLTRLQPEECQDPSEGAVDALDANSGSTQVILLENCHGNWSSAHSEAKADLSDVDYYLKKPRLLSYDGTDFIGRVVTAEVEVMEVLSKNPHPNIAEYYGCQREGAYITGIWLKRYMCTLEDLMEGDHEFSNSELPTDSDYCSMMKKIRAGVEHIHSLGYVHNDINPANIMLDEAWHPVIIDFNSCTRVGEPTWGSTPGWSRLPEKASFEDDLFALDLVERYLRKEYDPNEDELPEEQVEII